MKWLKRLLKSKISITIVTPPMEGVKVSHTPRDIEIEKPLIKRKTNSNLRFVREQPVDCFGKDGNEVFFTEKFEDGKWKFVHGSLAVDREKAVELHLKLLNAQPVEDVKTKTVLWEGLDKTEAKVWSSLIK